MVRGVQICQFWLSAHVQGRTGVLVVMPSFWLKGELVVPEVKPAAGPMLPFQQGMMLMLPLISVAFKTPAHPANVAIPAPWVTKTWDTGMSCVSSVRQVAGLFLFSFEVTFNAGKSNEKYQRRYVSSFPPLLMGGLCWSVLLHFLQTLPEKEIPVW